MNYSEKLKDPRWQKKRLEILERDHWACKCCGDKETTLHVHHFEYSGDPWDVPDKDLVALCDPCHQYEKQWRVEEETKLLDQLRKSHLLCVQMTVVRVALRDSDVFDNSDVWALDYFIRHRDVLRAFLKANGVVIPENILVKAQEKNGAAS